MADGYPRYVVNGQQQNVLISSGMDRRQALSNGLHVSNNCPRDNERMVHHVIGETERTAAAYQRSLHSLPSSDSIATRMSIPDLDDLPDIKDLRVLELLGSNPIRGEPSRFIGVQRQPEIPLPTNASSTLVVEGLPPNCTRREVSHLFRRFLGYIDTRLAYLEPRQSGGSPVVLCAVDFQRPAHAATAMAALQGYIFDDRDLCSGSIRLQFACSPSARSGVGHHV